MPNEVAPDGAPAVPPDALPSPRALRRATVIAVVVAAVLFVIAVLPAEYNVDPTGIGLITGLKEIGEIKEEARQEKMEAARVDSMRTAAAADSARRADTTRTRP